jgi:hypothetical protein
LSNENIPETGLTEQERKAISERVLFEVQLRKSLEDEPRNRRDRFKSWLESNFALLLIGSIISTLLVPYFQHQQDVLTWQRQNRYDNLKYKLGEMRSCLEDLLTLPAYSAAVSEISRPILAGRQITPEAYQRYQMSFSDLTQKRFEQVTKVIPRLIFFKHPEQIRGPYQQYVMAGTEFSSKIDALTTGRMAAPGKGGPPDAQQVLAFREQVAGLTKDSGNMNDLFDKVVREIRGQIDESERESEKF